MPLALEPATFDDVADIAALRNAVAADLTQKHGKGWWSGQCTERGVRADFRDAAIYLARDGAEAIATLRLATRKPWAIDRKYFTPCERPLYLTAMAVAPSRQRRGLGRLCLEAATGFARAFPAQAIYLDAFDHAGAGAGEFYRKCGYRETGRVVFRGVALIYFELLV